MKLIVAVDDAFGIGRNNKLLFAIPEDMAFFKASTLGKVVVMGRCTLHSFPHAAPLKNRVNIVLTRQEGVCIEGAITCASVGRLGRVLGEYSSDDVYVIGGHSVYSQLLNYCSEALVTKVYANGGADRYFPNIDDCENWVLVKKSDKKTFNGLAYCFCTYANKKVQPLPCE